MKPHPNSDGPRNKWSKILCGPQKYLACTKSVKAERPIGINNDDFENLVQGRLIPRDPENLKFDYDEAALVLMHHPEFDISL